MTVYTDNVKPFNARDELRCKCGSIRYDVKVMPDDDEERCWIEVSCRACGKALFYNGA